MLKVDGELYGAAELGGCTLERLSVDAVGHAAV
jgi:hypothetical protein